MSKKAPIEFFEIPSSGDMPPSFRADIALRKHGRRVIAEAYVERNGDHYLIQFKTGPLATHLPPRGVQVTTLGAVDINLPSDSPQLKKARDKMFVSVRDLVYRVARDENRGYTWPF